MAEPPKRTRPLLGVADFSPVVYSAGKVFDGLRTGRRSHQPRRGSAAGRGSRIRSR